MASKKELNYQIGYMVGDYIVDNHLPTLSTDMIHSMNVIQVSEELSEIWKEKDDKWFSLTFSKEPNAKEISNKLFYENRDWYKENIEKVYLKPELKVYVRSLSVIGDKEILIEGINQALWDCDFSHYKAVDVVKEEYIGCFVILKYDK